MSYTKPTILAQGQVSMATCQKGKPCGRPCSNKAK